MYKIQKLEKEDYDRGYLQLLKQLTIVGDISFSDFCNQLEYIDEDNFIKVYVIRDPNTQKPIVSGTIFIEKKFIHNLSSVGHIEDIVVDKKYRGNSLGKQMLKYLIEIAKDNKCYKIILNCKRENIGFYRKCGFKEKEVEMTLYL